MGPAQTCAHCMPDMLKDLDIRSMTVVRVDTMMHELQKLTIFSCASKEATLGPYAWHTGGRLESSLPEKPALRWLLIRDAVG